MTRGVPRIDNSPTRSGALRRHFADLRDSSHGEEAVTRPAKEAIFRRSVLLLGPHATHVLAALNSDLLLGTGTVEESGTQRAPDGGLAAIWSLTWPEQRNAQIEPIRLIATYGAGFHHPHLRGGTVGEWTLNVFTEEQAASEQPILAAIAEAELHNLVFQADYRLVPATTSHAPRVGHGFIR
jgi:hypothetical protein